ncbi:MAG: tRNA 2-selenouridine(34) synthase MnmH [Chitinophagaceae bacterium]
MSNQVISIARFLHPTDERPVLDVRSPGEFEHGHIPGALNLPLFSNEERAQVGTSYKQESPEKAFRMGIEMAGRKMGWYIDQALLMAPDKKIRVHCWRGGKRSGSMAWLLSMAGFDVEVLYGGYKNYRHAVHDYFDTREPRFIVVGGNTGSGKTYVLHQLRELGEQIIDLEAIAHHKGSAFGALGQAPQPTQEQFENDLFEAYRKLDKTKRIFIESESRKIGRCILPAGIHKAMQAYAYLTYSSPLEYRIQHLVEQYGTYSIEALEASFQKIIKRLGYDQYQLAIQALHDNRLADAARIALQFYDKAYAHSVSINPVPRKWHIDMQETDTRLIAQQIINACNSFELI